MKYIDAEKLFVEIERLKSVLADPLCCQGNILGPDWVAGGNKMLNEISSAITSLQQEQPEVDLEKEATKFVQSKEFIESEESPVLLVARHFYDLGLSTRK